MAAAGKEQGSLEGHGRGLSHTVGVVRLMIMMMLLVVGGCWRPSYVCLNEMLSALPLSAQHREVRQLGSVSFPQK